MKKKIDTKDFIEKIEQLAKERISNEEVVSISDFRSLKEKKQPPLILLIEDDESIRKSLKRLFDKQNYRSIIAADATELSNLIGEEAFDLMILDIGLPWINGLEVAKMMKENNDLKNIPIIFLSGRTSDQDVKDGFAAGASDYIKKPFDVIELQKTMSTLLELNT